MHARDPGVPVAPRTADADRRDALRHRGPVREVVVLANALRCELRRGPGRATVVAQVEAVAVAREAEVRVGRRRPVELDGRHAIRDGARRDRDDREGDGGSDRHVVPVPGVRLALRALLHRRVRHLRELHDAARPRQRRDGAVDPPEVVGGHAELHVVAPDVQLEALADGRARRHDAGVPAARRAREPGALPVAEHEDVEVRVAREVVAVDGHELDVDAVARRAAEVGRVAFHGHLEVPVVRRDPDADPVAARAPQRRHVEGDQRGTGREVDQLVRREVRGAVPFGVHGGHEVVAALVDRLGHVAHQVRRGRRVACPAMVRVLRIESIEGRHVRRDVPGRAAPEQRRRGLAVERLEELRRRAADRRGGGQCDAGRARRVVGGQLRGWCRRGHRIGARERPDEDDGERRRALAGVAEHLNASTYGRHVVADTTTCGFHHAADHIESRCNEFTATLCIPDASAPSIADNFVLPPPRACGLRSWSD